MTSKFTAARQNTTYFVDPRLKNELGSFSEKIFQDDGWAIVLRVCDFKTVEITSDGLIFHTDDWSFGVPKHMIFMRKTRKDVQ